MPVVMGIDPGLSGAIALYDAAAGELVFVADMPTRIVSRGNSGRRREIDADELWCVIRECGMFSPVHCVIESVGGLPGQSGSAAFRFGYACGIVHGFVTAARIPYTLIPSATWKRGLSIPAMGDQRRNKEAARAAATRLIPDGADQWTRKKDDGRAEAALLALWGAWNVLKAA